MNEKKETQKLTAKDVAELLAVSLATAEKYFKDIKQQYEINIVLFFHFKKYFKIE
ncbi:hypothetical protein [Flavobacterium crassostreae]|uniref:hypothetical protein n=1 Tax=Flavobacterium crassostreae TaxID=1763534 RepID=UPI0012FD78BB|nr:hypothetical protein [Flavobacterium crassostreae]